MLCVLLGRKDLRKQAFKRHFAPRSARFDVLENAVEIVDSRLQILQFAKGAIDFFKPVVDDLEGLIETLFERCAQFFVYGLTHFVKLNGVVLLHFLDGLGIGKAQIGYAFCRRLLYVGKSLLGGLCLSGKSLLRGLRDVCKTLLR